MYANNADLQKVEISTCCDGRGFHWQAEEPDKIVDRATGQLKAHLYRMGPTCQDCGGSGLRSDQKTLRSLALGRKLLIGALVLLFVVLPTLRAIL